MRYYRFLLRPPNTYLHPIESDVLPDTDAGRESLLFINLHTDGSGVAVYQMKGSDDGLEESLSNHESVIDIDVFGEKDDTFYLYVRFKPGEPATNLMTIADEYGLIMDTPFPFNTEGELEITIIGKNEAVQDSLPEFMRVTENTDIVLEQVGDYVPDSHGLKNMLTKKQLETIRIAVQKGYYDSPRSATHQDIAEEVGASASTVGEHLQKAESRLIPELVR